MTAESQLASVLIQIGRGRGVDVDQLVEELAGMTMPSFLDPSAFRRAVLDAAESYWRAELDERIARLRQQFGLAAARTPRPRPVPPAQVFEAPVSEPAVAAPELERAAPVVEPVTPEPAPGPLPVDLTPPDATIQEPSVDSALTAEEAEAMPSDATMIWTTRHE